MISVFLFYNKAYGLKEKFTFSDDLKHCNILIFDGKDYILTWIGSNGIKSRVMNIDSLIDYLENIKKKMNSISAIIVTTVNDAKLHKNYLLSINSCNEVSKRHGCVDIGLTLNPCHLYNLLHFLNQKRNFKIQYSWRRKDER